VSSDESLDADLLRAELVTSSSLWRHIDVVPKTGSTNADLVAAARAGAPAGQVLVTDFQSAGKGRQGRTWMAPPGTSIAMSVLLAPAVEVSRWTWLPLLTGLAVGEAVRRVGGLPTGLKWPNDVLVEERKLCGILAERVDTSSGPACVVGIGINVSLAEADLPVPTATSLRIARAAAGLPGVPGRTPLVLAVLQELAYAVREWEADPGSASLVERYRRRCVTLNRPVRVLLGDQRVLTGVASGIDPDGRLMVQTDSGTQILGAGDVVHVR
jgi:BirA family biotin operon repressor/biotin-[acetyl-CoA-carboxylase] ligase